MTLYLLLIIVPMILAAIAQMKVSGAYNRWVKVPAKTRMTGREAAAYVMRSAGIDDVEIGMCRGHLTDHYNPASKQLVLSEENYHGTSLAAIGVAAHEAGHAIQHKIGYAALNFRMALVPITNIASQLLPIVMIGGFFFGMLGLLKLGVLVYLVLTIFQLVTLPVEFDASHRAKKQLVGLGILDKDEMVGVNQTLNAAALTYLAAFIASLGNLVYLLLLTRSRD
jgi:Zn-dependent membrane protease YugP